MGRKRKFDPETIVTDQDLGRAWNELHDYRKDRSLQRRVVHEFLKFLSVNDFSTCAEAIEGYIGVNRRPPKPTGWGTLRNYVEFIWSALCASRLFVNLEDRHECRLLADALERRYADEERATAPPLTTDHAVEYIKMAGRTEAQILALMLFSGARAADIWRLRDRQVRITRDKLEIEFRLTKNRQHANGRAVLRLRGEFPMLLWRQGTTTVRPWAIATSRPLSYRYRSGYRRFFYYRNSDKLRSFVNSDKLPIRPISTKNGRIHIKSVEKHQSVTNRTRNLTIHH